MVLVNCNCDTNQTMRQLCQDGDYFSFISGHPALGTLPGPPQKFSRYLPKEQRKVAATKAAVVLACLEEDNMSYHADQMTLKVQDICYGNHTLFRRAMETNSGKQLRL